MVNIARTVVYRHPCACETASRPLEPGEKAEHRFEVDGKPFPFHIAEPGAKFTKTATGLYLVECTIFPLSRATNEPLRTVVDLYGQIAFDHVDGRREPFPWALVDKPVTLIGGDRRNVTTVALTFIAEYVDTDAEIGVEQPTDDIRVPLTETVSVSVSRDAEKRWRATEDAQR